MTRFRNVLAVASLTSGMLFSVSAVARADDHDGWHDRYEQREHYREYWRDRDGRYYHRVWDPYRGWIVMRYYPPAPEWEGHDRGRHNGWYGHEHREWHDRDDD